MPDTRNRSRIRLRIRPSLPATLLAACTAIVPALSAAQSAAPPAVSHSKADPLDASAEVPAVRVRSSFAGYHGLADEKVGSWREANDTVGRIGGWKAYAREAAQPDAPTQADAPERPAAAGGAGGNAAPGRDEPRGDGAGQR
ncbi:MAG: hypothetical protein R3E41_03235 [Burkholderiaceae bacterium]